MSETRATGRASVLPAICDAVLILVFVLIGRGSHEESFSFAGALSTAWPFIAGAAIGWLIMRAWRFPRRVVWTGIGIWISTALFGMLFRAASGQGVQLSFVIVTVLVLGAFLLGWRGIAALVARATATRLAA